MTKEKESSWVKVMTSVVALVALGLSAFNTYWQYQEYLGRQLESQVFVSGMETLTLRGGSSDWRTNLTITLTVVSLHYSRVSVRLGDGNFTVFDSIKYMLVEEYPCYVTISEDASEFVEQGLREIQLRIPIRAQFLIGGYYQAQHDFIKIGKFEFPVSFQDLQTKRGIIIEAQADVVWEKS